MDELDLVRRCQSGDKDAFRGIYDRYCQPMLGVACRMLGNQADAEDVVQTAFLKLFNSIQKFQYRSKFSTYLYQIVTNVCFDLLNKRSKMQVFSLEHDQRVDRADQDMKLVLEEAIALLPPRMRACFVLFAVEGCKQTEVAEILGLSLGGVKSNIHHAKARLQAMLKEQSEDVR